VVHAPVSLRDVAATIVSLLGIDGRNELPGRTLARFWTPPTDADTLPSDTIVASIRRGRNQPAWYPVSRGDIHSVAFGGFRYIKNQGDGQEELYNFADDSLERVDLAGSTEGRGLVPAYRAALDRMVSSDER
jgi:arylsulfatase A-like enzyme